MATPGKEDLPTAKRKDRASSSPPTDNKRQRTDGEDADADATNLPSAPVSVDEGIRDIPEQHDTKGSSNESGGQVPTGSEVNSAIVISSDDDDHHEPTIPQQTTTGPAALTATKWWAKYDLLPPGYPGPYGPYQSRARREAATTPLTSNPAPPALTTLPPVRAAVSEVQTSFPTVRTASQIQTAAPQARRGYLGPSGLYQHRRPSADTMVISRPARQASTTAPQASNVALQTLSGYPGRSGPSRHRSQSADTMVLSRPAPQVPTAAPQAHHSQRPSTFQQTPRLQPAVQERATEQQQSYRQMHTDQNQAHPQANITSQMFHPGMYPHHPVQHQMYYPGMYPPPYQHQIFYPGTYPPPPSQHQMPYHPTVQQQAAAQPRQRNVAENQAPRQAAARSPMRYPGFAGIHPSLYALGAGGFDPIAPTPTVTPATMPTNPPTTTPTLAKNRTNNVAARPDAPRRTNRTPP